MKSPTPQTLTLLLALTAPTTSLLQKHSTGRLPALGWNSWNAFHCNVSEANLMTAANEMASLGLKAAGYEYVNSDDCWSVKNTRDNVTHRIVPDPDKFPDGIDGTAKKIHALGFKMGIYSSAGLETCAGYPASLGYEDVDAEAFADWGIDYLKYDNCGVPQTPINWTDKYVACVPDSSTFPNGTCTNTNTPNLAPPSYNWSTSHTHTRFTRMRDALLAQNRTLLYSLCEWGQADVLSWGNSTGNSWRMSGDITADWGSVAEILNQNSFYLNEVGFWGHNDADMLEVGNGNLTEAETRTHFAFWAAMKSPLLIGTALDAITADNVGILTNPYLLAFNQDPVHGTPAMPYKWGVNPDWTFNMTHPAEYWSGQYSGGTMVLMLNTLDVTARREVAWKEVPGLAGKGAAFEVVNAWTGAKVGCVRGGYGVNLKAHDTAVLVVGDECG